MGAGKRVVNNPFHQTEKLMKEIPCKHPMSLSSVQGEACLLLWPLTGTDTEQRAPERQEAAHRTLTVKHPLTSACLPVRPRLPFPHPRVYMFVL